MILRILLFVEVVFSERVYITIYLIFFFAINVLERVRAQFAFLSLESREFIFEICLTIPYHISIVFDFIRSITLNILRSMSTAHKVFLFLVVLALENA